MIQNARFGHTNVIARDWRALSAFYQRVFGCIPVPPERNYADADLEAGTGVKGSSVQGVHLRLPGLGPDGPTPEVYSHSISAEPVRPEVNRPGFAHIAFVVPDVLEAQREVLAAGGSLVGEVVTLQTATGASLGATREISKATSSSFNRGPEPLLRRARPEGGAEHAGAADCHSPANGAARQAGSRQQLTVGR